MFLLFLFLVQYGFACNQMFNVTSRVFLDISIDNMPIGRIVLGLYGEITPKTSENFRQLCTGEFLKNGKPLTYKGKRFSRIIPSFVIQGGDVGSSIYGAKFEDENFVVSQCRPGILVMANAGRNTNQSQFYITTANVAYLNGKLVAFGTVLEGMDVVYKIDSCGTQKGVPKCKVVMEDTGELKERDDSVDDLYAYIPPILKNP